MSAEPQIAWRLVTQEDELVVLGSDGVYDVMSDDRVVALAAAAGSDAAKAAADVVEEAAAKWRTQPGADNVTAVVLLDLSLG